MGREGRGSFLGCAELDEQQLDLCGIGVGFGVEVMKPAVDLAGTGLAGLSGCRPRAGALLLASAPSASTSENKNKNKKYI